MPHSPPRPPQVTPLRVRPSDIPPLVDYFLRSYARKRGLGAFAITPGALRRLERWGGAGSL